MRRPRMFRKGGFWDQDSQFHPPASVFLDQNVHLRLATPTSENVPIILVTAMCRPDTSHRFRNSVGNVESSNGA